MKWKWPYFYHLGTIISLWGLSVSPLSFQGHQMLSQSCWHLKEVVMTLKPASLPAPCECLDETPCHYTETHWVLLSIFFPVCNLIDKKGIFDHRGPQVSSLLLLVARQMEQGCVMKAWVNTDHHWWCWLAGCCGGHLRGSLYCWGFLLIVVGSFHYNILFLWFGAT